MMFRQNMCSKFVSALLMIALVTPYGAFAADPGTIARVQDVELHEHGMLATRVVNLQGEPVIGEEVLVQYDGREIAKAVSDDEGYVAIKGLRPGIHTICTTRGTTACRFWQKDTAPPSAVKIPAVVSDNDVIRGQFGAFNLPMLVYAGVTAAALVIAIEAEGEADDANARVAALEERVEALEAASP